MDSMTIAPTTPSPGLKYYYPLQDPPPARTVEADVVVYGGTSAGVIAAVQAKKMGKSAVIVGPDRHLGGLSSGGLGWTDTGDKSVIGTDYLIDDHLKNLDGCKGKPILFHATHNTKVNHHIRVRDWKEAVELLYGEMEE